MVGDGEAVPRGGGQYLVGHPYHIAGRTYYPHEDEHYVATGISSWYGDAFHGRKTANGEVYDKMALSAAHPTMPLPSYARVTNLANGYSVIVRVNDRGPYHGGRVMDVSSRVADVLDFKRMGTARVKVEYVGRAPLEGSDDNELLATLRTDGGPASIGGGDHGRRSRLAAAVDVRHALRPAAASAAGTAARAAARRGRGPAAAAAAARAPPAPEPERDGRRRRRCRRRARPSRRAPAAPAAAAAALRSRPARSLGSAEAAARAAPAGALYFTPPHGDPLARLLAGQADARAATTTTNNLPSLLCLAACAR